MISRFFDKLNQVNQGYGRVINRLGRVETLGSLLILLLWLFALWIFAWNAHLIGPWVDNFFGFKPSDIDSPGKVRWRRMWSTTFCVTGIVVVVVAYFLNLYKRLRDGATASTDSDSPSVPSESSADAEEAGPGTSK